VQKYIYVVKNGELWEERFGE